MKKTKLQNTGGKDITTLAGISRKLLKILTTLAKFPKWFQNLRFPNLRIH